MSHLRLVDADSDLATIRLRTVFGRLYDIDVRSMAQRLASDPFDQRSAGVTEVPTWEGVPIPDDLRDHDHLGVKRPGLDWWKRGVTDANSAGDAGVIA